MVFQMGPYSVAMEVRNQYPDNCLEVCLDIMKMPGKTRAYRLDTEESGWNHMIGNNRGGEMCMNREKEVMKTEEEVLMREEGMLMRTGGEIIMNLRERSQREGNNRCLP